MENILVIAEHRGGKIREQTLSTLGKALELERKYDFELSCVILGHGIEKLARQLSTYAENVFYVESEKFELYNNELYKAQISDLVKKLRPKLILMGQTALSMDLMPGLSAKLDLPLITDCVDIEFEKNKLVALRHVYEGRVVAKISLSPSPTYLTTLRSGLEPKTKDKHSKLIEMKPVFEAKSKSKTIKLVEPMIEDVDISKAEIVVGVGLGIASRENIQLAKDLAHVLGGVVGCTRPIVDKKWLSQTRQIGFSGKLIKPKLYIALGLSGSTHHVKGIEGAKRIIAINKDPGAPIFNRANYGVVGDLFEIVPPLMGKLREKIRQKLISRGVFRHDRI